MNSEQIGKQTKTSYEQYKKIKKFNDVGFFLQNYVNEGGVASKDLTYNNVVNVTDISAALSDNVVTRDGASFKTEIPNTTYYLDFAEDGDWKWGTAHPSMVHLSIAEVRTDSNGNVLEIIDRADKRGGFRLKDEFGLEDYATKENVNDIAVNVKSFGAKGDGSADDTKAINDAIEYAHAKGYQKVIVPSGTYMIQGATGGTTHEGQGGGIKILSNIMVLLNENATLKQIPTQHGNYNIVYFSKCKNSGISGGVIQGDRHDHLGSTGEWGYGIGVFSGENIKIENITVKDCWGDGINIQMDKGVRDNDSIPLREKQSKNVTVFNVVCDNNRRQGMSIESLLGGYVTNSKFVNTNGTNPQSGVDIEPYSTDKLVEDVFLSNNLFENNGQFGLLILNKGTKGIIVDSNVFKNNKSIEGQIGGKNTSEITISNNMFECLQGGGIKFTSSSNISILGNQFKERGVTFFGCKGVMVSSNSISSNVRDLHTYVWMETFEGSICENIQVFNNLFRSDSRPLISHAIVLSGKEIFINNNYIGQATGAVHTVGDGTHFEFKNNFIIDMSIQGFNIGSGTYGLIEDNTFSGICYNNNGQSILRVRSGAEATIGNNILRKNRIGGGDLGSGRPSLYLTVEANGKVVVYDNSTDTLNIMNYSTESEIIPKIDYRIGNTTNRPFSPKVGAFYFDTSLNRPIWWSGTNWVDAAGTVL